MTLQSRWSRPGRNRVGDLSWTDTHTTLDAYPDDRLSDGKRHDHFFSQTNNKGQKILYKNLNVCSLCVKDHPDVTWSHSTSVPLSSCVGPRGGPHRMSRSGTTWSKRRRVGFVRPSEPRVGVTPLGPRPDRTTHRNRCPRGEIWRLRPQLATQGHPD